MELAAEGTHVKELDEEPELSDVDTFFLEAFFRLTTSRQLGFGLGGIPVSEMTNLCNEYCMYSMDDRLDLIDILSSIDSFFIGLGNSDKPKKKK